MNRAVVAGDLESKNSRSLFGVNRVPASVFFTRAVLHFMNLQGIAIQQGNDAALVAQPDGGAGDLVYSSVVLAARFDVNAFPPGGASRIPNGIDTDTTADWVRNDFDGAGFSGFPETPSLTEALSTRGAVNSLSVSVPAPATLALLGPGVAGIGYQRRKQIRAALSAMALNWLIRF